MSAALENKPLILSKPSMLNIGHRGFRREYPENTILSFDESVRAGAQIVELDVHVSKEQLLVISHDGTTKRVFGEPHVIEHTLYNPVLSSLRTLRSPREPMPLLRDMLVKLVSDPLYTESGVRLMIDIKWSVPIVSLELLYKLLTEDEQLKEHSLSFWQGKLIIGIWSLPYLRRIGRFFPCSDWQLVHIGFDRKYALKFTDPSVTEDHTVVSGVSIVQYALFGSAGDKFLTAAQKAGTDVYAWTVNDAMVMRFCVARRLAGCVTDSPDLLKEVLEAGEENEGADEGNVGKSSVCWSFERIWRLPLRLQMRYWLFTTIKCLIINPYVYFHDSLFL